MENEVKEVRFNEELLDPEFERMARKGCPVCGVSALNRIPRTLPMKLMLVSKAYRCSNCGAVTAKWLGVLWQVKDKAAASGK